MPNLYVGEGGSPVRYAPSPPVRANPGPPARGGYSGNRGGGSYSSSLPAAPPNVFAGFPGPAVDIASQLVQQFLSLVGFPTNVDANRLALDILQRGLVSDPQAAYASLFYGQALTDEQRAAHPGAQFGMDAMSFQSRRDALDQVFTGLVGNASEGLQSVAANTDLQSLYYRALKGNWSQGQVLQQLQGDPRFAQLRIEQPWLVQGQGEQQVAQSFSSIYGTAPVDVGSLAAWFRFNTGTAQMSRTSREAITVLAPQTSTSESR